jgi:transposase
MARISSAISDELLEKCQITLKQQGKTGEISRRLQAIISAKYHNISKVASIFGMTRVTMMRWIKDFDKNHKKESKHYSQTATANYRKRYIDNSRYCNNL